MTNFQKANQIFQTTLKKHYELIEKQSEMFYEDLVLALEEVIHNYTQSLELYKPKSTSIYKNRGIARFNLVDLLLQNNEHKKALQLLESAVYDFCRVKVDDRENYLEERFYSAEVNKKIASTYQTLEDTQHFLIYWQFTKEDYEAILEIDENNIDALNNLAFGKFEFARDYEMQNNKQAAVKLFEEALEHYFKVLNIEYTTDTLFDISAVYSRLAETYDGLGDYDNALSSFADAIEYSQKIIDIDKNDLPVLINLSIFKSDMAKIYTLVGKDKEAINYYDESINDSLEIIELSPDNIENLNNIAITYSHKANLYAQKGVINKNITQLQEAMKLLQTSSDYYDKAYSLDTNDILTLINQALNYEQISMVFIYIKRDDDAINTLNKGIELLQKAQQIKETQQVINALVQMQSKLAQLYNKQKRHTEALTLLESAKKQMVHNYSDINRTNNNATILSELGLTHFKLSHKQKALNTLRTSLVYYEKALKINAHNIMVQENMAKVLHHILKIEPNKNHIQQSIQLNHQIITLYENYFFDISYENDALSLTQQMMIPLLQLIESYRLLKSPIGNELIHAIEKVKAKKLKQLMLNNFLEKEITVNSQEVHELKNNLQRVKEKIQKLTNEVDIELKQKLYDEYQDTIHQLSNLIPLFHQEHEKNVQSCLKSDESIIYPIYDGKHLTTISINHRETVVYQEEIEKDLNLMNYVNQGSKELLQGLSFINDALLKTIPNETKKIYFSPFGVLNLLPLHAIVTGRSNGYETYLIEEYEINYIPSLSILNHLKNRPPFTVDSNENLFISIHEFQREANSCQSIIKGGNMVNLELESCKDLLTNTNHNVVHFSTHGSTDILEPLNSRILLQESSHSLSLLDIYGLKFRANLVTLSACKTNISKVESADEVLAFERAFLISGADSTMTTFESVFSGTTEQFMEYFYTSMNQKHQSLSSAFQSASIRAIEDDNMEWKLFRFTGI
jgi:CHAT domain-containing protein